MQAGWPSGSSVYAATNSLSIASGRVSYILGIQGPCLTVETACSASLVALHVAMRSVQFGECTEHLAQRRQPHAQPGMQQLPCDRWDDLDARPLPHIRQPGKRLRPWRGPRKHSCSRMLAARACFAAGLSSRTAARRASPRQTVRRNRRSSVRPFRIRGQRAGDTNVRGGAWHGHCSRRSDRDRLCCCVTRQPDWLHAKPHGPQSDERSH